MIAGAVAEADLRDFNLSGRSDDELRLTAGAPPIVA